MEKINFQIYADDAIGLHTVLGIKEGRIDDKGRMCIDLPIDEKVVNPLFIAHGGTLFTLCDTAVGAHMVHVNREWGVTLDSTMQFYRPALLGDTVTAVVTERKRGKSVLVCLVEVFNNAEKLVAEGTFSMFIKGKVDENGKRTGTPMNHINKKG